MDYTKFLFLPTIHLYKGIMERKWFEDLPEQCPPKDARACKGIFYRIATGNPAQSADFFSQRRLAPDRVFKGKGIDECIACAVSLFSHLEDAKKRMKLPKFKQAHIAAIELHPKDGWMKKTFSDSHYSWWRTTDFNVSQAEIIAL